MPLGGSRKRGASRRPVPTRPPKRPYRLRSPFARLTQVSAYQIIRRDDDVLVRVVPRAGAGRELPEDVAAAVSTALAEAGAHVPVSVTLVPEIEREPGAAAKVKLVKARR
jgi:hypothetical protein